MDSADVAAVHDFTEEALRSHASFAGKRLTRGRCAFCESVIDPGLIYCDKDCLNDYEREQQIKERTKRW